MSDRRLGRYAKLLGTLWRHPKGAETSNAALGVWARCLSYCCDNQTDGHIPAAVVEGFCRNGQSRKWRRVLTELTTPIVHVAMADDEPTPWLHRTQTGYQIHDYNEVNVSRIRRERAANVQRTCSERANRVEQNQTLRPGERAYPRHQDTKTPIDDEDSARARCDATPEAIAREWNRYLQLVRPEAGGHPLRMFREDFEALAVRLRQLDRWREFVVWYWRPGGWAAEQFTPPKPKSLVRAWDENVAEWRDPKAFVEERRRRSSAGPKAAAPSPAYHRELD